MGISLCDGPRTQEEAQGEVFSAQQTAQAMLVSGIASQDDLCFCQDGIIIHWTKEQDCCCDVKIKLLMGFGFFT